MGLPVIRTLLLAISVFLLWSGVTAPATAAEVLQVQTSTVLQVGDHNRTYTVQLPCIEVESDREAEAIAWLRQALPRRRRVNLRPVGSSDGVLLARVTPIGSSDDLSAGLISAGLASDPCVKELG